MEKKGNKGRMVSAALPLPALQPCQSSALTAAVPGNPR
ncbi:hypothetical protein I315_01036 [Cryptococcus gattii Ru294]|nr:hypothetical protein I315_01036 [Cryptococcus gattii Ru294]